MFQKFNSDNLTTRFIKNLVSTIYIPTASIWRPGKNLTSGFTYVTRNHIVRAKKDYDASSNVEIDIHDSEYFDIIKPYIEGEFYPGVTTTYNSGTSIYDDKTHQYLGQYLRQVRDLHGIDLMPYYNCWTGSYVSGISIDSEKGLTRKDLDTYNVVAIPVKFNEKYTIYLNSDTSINYAFVYYDGITITDPSIFSTSSKFGVIDYISVDKPVLLESLKPRGDEIEAPSNVNTVYQEDYLTLLLQIPVNNKSLIYVTEGDTRHQKILSLGNSIDNYVVSLPECYYGNNSIAPLKIYSPSSLTRTISSTSYAFNDRLIEYLLWNVISPEDMIPMDIVRTQEYITSKKCKEVNGFNYDDQSEYNSLVKGVWTSDMQKFIYKLSTQTNKNKVLVDINGFVDKDSEQIILRGRE